MSELYTLPDGWEWKKLDELTEVNLGKTPTRSKFEYFLGDKVAYGGGGSYPLEKNNYSWITEVDHDCDTSQVIVINKLIRPIEELPK